MNKASKKEKTLPHSNVLVYPKCGRRTKIKSLRPSLRKVPFGTGKDNACPSLLISKKKATTLTTSVCSKRCSHKKRWSISYRCAHRPVTTSSHASVATFLAR